MIIFRYKAIGWFVVVTLTLVPTRSAVAQVSSNPIALEPMALDPAASTTHVQNIYGKCASAVVQVLGIAGQSKSFFTVDSAANNADVVVIVEGGRRELHLKQYLSDYNGVACVGSDQVRLLIWSNCSGTACGDDFSFTVVDPNTLRIVAGGSIPCDTRCAIHASGSNLPAELNR